ncbi:MAG: trigger factor [Candidatus Moranbacteria bacterium]|nr:trigger factor [Candidatus Moranbacteria bacterium]
MDIKKLPKSQVELKFTVPSDEFDRFLENAAAEISKDLKIDGFRPGKAPFDVVEKKAGSEKILAHGAEKAIKKTYVDAILKGHIEVIGEPKINISKIAKGNDFEFTATVAVMPKIELPNYRSIAKSIERKNPEKAGEKEIEKELETLQKSRAKLVTVARGARKGDRVEIDFDVFVDGKIIDGGSAKNHPLTIGENYFIPGFEDNLVGMGEKDKKEFDLAFPKDYHQKDLSGKPARFKVKMKIVQEKELPKINDDFAKSLGDFENFEALKKSLSEGINLEQEKKESEKWRTETIEKIAGESKIELPDILIDQELEKMLGEMEQNIASMGMDLETYLGNIKKSKDELVEGWKDTAEKRVRAALVLREIAAGEEIKAPAEEVEQEINKAMAYYKTIPDMEKNIDMEKLYNYIQGIILNEKVFQFLEKL